MFIPTIISSTTGEPDRPGQPSLSESADSSEIMSAPSSSAVLVAFIGTYGTSWAMLFYDPAVEPGGAFTLKYLVSTSGMWNITQIVAYVYGHSVLFYLFYDDTGAILEDKDGNDIFHSKIYYGSSSAIGSVTWTLSSEPDWAHLRWYFEGDAFGRSWSSVKAEQDKLEQLRWTKIIWTSFKVAKFIIIVVGAAAACYASGGSLLPLVAIIIPTTYAELVEAVTDEVCDTVVENKIEETAQTIRAMYSDADWDAIMILGSGQIQKTPELSLTFSGDTYGVDTWNHWEQENGQVDYASYQLKIRVARTNKVTLVFSLPEQASVLDSASGEGDIDPGTWARGATYERELVPTSTLNILKLMKHDDYGKPYFEYTMHVVVNPEVVYKEGDLRTWFVGHGHYSENQNFTATLYAYTVDNQTSPLYTENKKIVNVEFQNNPAKQDFKVGLVLGVVAYIFYKTTQTLIVVIQYPPYEEVKSLLCNPHMPGLGDISIAPPPTTAPPSTLAINIPSGNLRTILCIPQIPSGQEWKATLAFNVPSPYDYSQVIYISPGMAKHKINLDLSSLDAEFALEPPSIDDIMAVSAVNPETMAFIIPTMPTPGEVQTISISNPNNLLLVTAQTTTAYPLTISIPDIPKTTYIKIPSSGNLNLHVLDPSTPNPVVPRLTNEVGVFINTGAVTSTFNFYSNIFTNRTSRVAHGSVTVPPSAEYTEDILNSGLTFSESDSVPKVTATKVNAVSIALQLIGHGVNLEYSNVVGTKNYKIEVTNTGVVQDTFNLTIPQKPTGWTAALSSNRVTLASGDSTEVDLTITAPPGQKYPNRLIGPWTSQAVNGLIDQSFSITYSVTVKAVMTNDTQVWDTVKVPVAVASGFEVELTEGNTNVSGPVEWRNALIILRGNLTIESGGDVKSDNSTIVVEEVDGRRPIIRLLVGAYLNLTDSNVESSDDGSPFDLEVDGHLIIKGTTKLKDTRLKLRSNLDIAGRARLFLSNTLVEVGKPGSTPTITVGSGSSLGLLNSRIQSYSPSNPYPLRGGGKIVNFQSTLVDQLEFRPSMELPVYSRHIYTTGPMTYSIQIRNLGNQPDTITLTLNRTVDPQWTETLSQSVFSLPPSGMATASLTVRPLVPVPMNPLRQVQVKAQSMGDSERTCSINTYTKFVPSSPPTPSLAYATYDISTSKQEPAEDETISISVIIHNDGNTPATSVQTTFYDTTTGYTIGTVMTPSIAAKNYAIATTSWIIRSASTHSIASTTTYPGGAPVSANCDVAVKDKPDGSMTATIAFDPPLIAYTGESIYFDAFNCTDTDSNITECLWNFGDGSIGSGPLLLYSYAENGVYQVTLRLIDSDGLNRTSTLEITVIDRPPTPDFTATPDTALEDQPILFNASTSFDSDGTVTQYAWNFGDGYYGSGMQTTHQYHSLGTYTVTLTITDNDGTTAARNATIRIIPPETIIHDITVHNVTTNKNVVAEGAPLEITINVTNHGNRNESFDLTIYYNVTNIIQTLPLSMNVGNSTRFTITWNTAGLIKAKYNLSAYAVTVPGETSTEDNTYNDGIVTITILGDCDGDFKVNIVDLFYLGRAYNSTPTNPNWNPNCDFNDDLNVTKTDLVNIAENYGNTNP